MHGASQEKKPSSIFTRIILFEEVQLKMLLARNFVNLTDLGLSISKVFNIYFLPQHNCHLSINFWFFVTKKRIFPVTI